MDDWLSTTPGLGSYVPNVQLPVVDDDTRGTDHWDGAEETLSHAGSARSAGSNGSARSDGSVIPPSEPPSEPRSVHADQPNIGRLIAKLTNLVGMEFDDDLKKAMGMGVVPKCLVDTGTSNNDFVDFRPLANEVDGITYVRALVVNVPIDCFSPDAKSARDFRTPLDPVFQARCAEIAALLSMLFIGTAKGLYTGSDAEITRRIINGLEGEELEKAKKERVPLSSYLWCPAQKADGSWTNPNFEAAQFHFAVEALYDEEETHIVGVRFWKLVSLLKSNLFKPTPTTQQS
jgi:hypothetical protein